MSHRHGDIVQTRAGPSTILADLDFESFSTAGYEWLESEQKWVSTGSKAAPGLAAVGTAVYAAHPSTEVLSLAYDLKDGLGARLWAPGMSPPVDLFAHLAAGKLIEAHNSFFEFCIWNYVCHARMGWPVLDYRQLRCSAAKSKAWSLPAALIKGGEALHLPVLKDEAAGKRVIQRYSIPRKPTAKDPRRRIRPDEEFVGIDLYQYNIQDIVAEAALSAAVPDLSPDEQEMWLIDQRINIRGVQIDIPTVHAMTAILDAGLVHNDRALVSVTNGALVTASEVSKMQAYLHGLGVHLDALDEEAVDAALKIHTSGTAYDVLRIRQASASAGVKKLYALARQTNDDHRYRGLFNYYRAHTGRWSSEGFQTQNLVSSGPDMRHCDVCHGEFPHDQEHCRHCEHDVFVPLGKAREWNGDIMQTCIRMLEHGDFNRALQYFGVHLFAVMSACLRGMVIAKPGCDLISSDYSAIEAVVLAVLAGETWRVDIFRGHGKIYEASIAKTARIPVEEILEFKKIHGRHHHLRKRGKVRELSCGFGGWIGAAKNFGADEFMTDEEIKQDIIAWRNDSPAIVEFWGGQWRKAPDSWDFTWELYGLEGTAIRAVLEPGVWHPFRGLQFITHNDVLYVQLPSGRRLSYHEPRLAQVEDRFSKNLKYQLTHMIYNTNAKKGGFGWVRVEAYYGTLTENIVQAVARDILANGIKNCERAGYDVVMHVHDEIVAEVPEGWGSVEELENLMMDLPVWAKGWPIKASGGWRGKRYRKE